MDQSLYRAALTAVRRGCGRRLSAPKARWRGVADRQVAGGETSYYIPAGTWTHLQTGETVRGPVWVSEVCDFLTVPVFVRPGTALPIGTRDDRPDYPYDADVTLRVYEFADGDQTMITVPGPTGAVATTFEVVRDRSTLTATRLQGTAPWRLLLMGQPEIKVPADTDQYSIELGSIEV
jgi:alpha-D-xyloside xylohydrolase